MNKYKLLLALLILPMFIYANDFKIRGFSEGDSIFYIKSNETGDFISEESDGRKFMISFKDEIFNFKTTINYYFLDEELFYVIIGQDASDDKKSIEDFHNKFSYVEDNESRIIRYMRFKYGSEIAVTYENYWYIYNWFISDCTIELTLNISEKRDGTTEVSSFFILYNFKGKESPPKSEFSKF